jgi:hypothetical protein
MEPRQGTPSPSAESLPTVVWPDETSQATPDTHDQTITIATTSSNSVLGPESSPQLTSLQTLFQVDRSTPGISVSDVAQTPNTRRANGSAQSPIRHAPDNVNHGEAVDNFPAPLAAVDTIHDKGLPVLIDPHGLTEPSEITDRGRRFAAATLPPTPPDTSLDPVPGPLQDQIKSAIIQRDVDRPGFVPKRQLVKIITKDTVENELQNHEPSRSRPFRLWMSRSRSKYLLQAPDVGAEAQRICGTGEQSFPIERHQEADGPRSTRSPTLSPPPPFGATAKTFRKIFAILVLIELPSAIRGFLEHGVSDVDLPFVKVPLKSKIPMIQRWELRIKHQNTRLECFKDWKRSNVAKFEEKQWTFLAPFFALCGQQSFHLRTIYHYPLQNSAILPFTKWEPVGSSGGCGQVYRAEIHPHHHSFHTYSHGNHKDVFAVKQLFSGDKEVFTREVQMLKRLTGNLAHSHLISLLATYHHQGRYHLIFPWAPADLLGYWKNENPQPKNDRDTALWVAEQCQGLAEGLARIHRYQTYTGDSILNSALNKEDSQQPKNRNPKDVVKMLFGRHGDIKPANILWFPANTESGKGILKITDFGIAEFTTQNTSSRNRVPNSPEYRAPETDLEGAVISSSYDIWALGCVYLEFITWCFGGWARIEAFLDKRDTVDDYYHKFYTGTFFTYETDGPTGKLQAKVKDAVHEVGLPSPVHLS